MKEQYKRLGKNTLIVFIGNFGTKLISFFLLPLYTRWLTVEDYGTADLISSYAALLLVLVSGCIMDAVFVFPKGESHETQGKYFSTSFGFSAITITLSGIALYGFQLIGGESIFRTYTIAIWAIMSTSIIQSLTQQFARSIDKMKVFGATGIVQTLSLFAFSAALIPAHGVKGYIISIAIANLATALFTLIFSGGWRYLSFRLLSRDHLRKMLTYSIPLIPANIMFWLIGTINRPIMESHCGLHIIGLYAIAMKIVSVVGILSSIILSSWQISVLEEFGKETYSDFYNKVIKLFTQLMVIAFFAISVMSPLILKIVTTEEYFGANRYIPMLMLGTIVATFANLVAANFSAVKKSKYIFHSSMCAAATAIILNVLLIPTIGIWGALLAYVLSFSVMALTRVVYSWKLVKLDNIYQYILLSTACTVYCVLAFLFEDGIIPAVFGIVMCIILGYFTIKPLIKYIERVKSRFIGRKYQQ